MYFNRCFYEGIYFSYKGHLNIRTHDTNKVIVFSSGSTAYLTIDSSATLTNFNKASRHLDSVISYFGTGLDGRIYHDGNNFYIAQVTTGDLYIQNELDDKDVILRSDNGSGGVTAYLTLDGSEPDDSSKGNLESGKHYYTISYQLHIVNWLESCLKEASNQPILRESIKQYIILIKKLTNTLNTEQEKELTEVIFDHYEEAKLIASNYHNIVNK